MSIRSRPRAGQLKDEVDEERTLWASIQADAKKIDSLVAQSDSITKRIVELQAQQDAAEARGLTPSSASDAEMEKLLRENIKLTEEIQQLCESDSGQNDILKSLEILIALRDAHEPEPISTSRAASVGKSQRDRQTKRKHTELDDRESVAAESPGGGPSPKVMISTKDRFMAKSGSRAGSVPVRESSVKAEDAEVGDQIKEKQRAQLTHNTEVLYRNNKSRQNSEGEGILCRVTQVIGEGKQRRYEIIDADPDPPTPAQPYRASVNHLVPIPPPSSNLTLPDLPAKRHVLALYPGTTTFYKAEVVAGWSAGKKREGSKGLGKGIKEEGGKGEKGHAASLVRLRFEGEEEAEREMSVERRYVLPDK